jgi:hypothetical protein
MNERIQELAKQAGISILWEYDGYDGHAVVANLKDIEKFAELIALDCMKLCAEVKEDLFTIEDNDKRDLAEMAATFCYEAIKSEFGVEE